MSEIPALFTQRAIILRHRKAAMYHPMVEALAMTLVDVPFTLITIILFTIIIYFIVNLQQTAGQFLYGFDSSLTDYAVDFHLPQHLFCDHPGCRAFYESLF
jgi:ABC-type multidrug transport system permease subunit